jgi:hypothetical protein
MGITPEATFSTLEIVAFPDDRIIRAFLNE